MRLLPNSNSRVFIQSMRGVAWFDEDVLRLNERALRNFDVRSHSQSFRTRRIYFRSRARSKKSLGWLRIGSGNI